MNFNGHHIIALNELESTNNYAKQLVSDKVEKGTVVLAQFQSKGRGQQGNYWESKAGKNLLFSLILYPDFLEAGFQFYLSMIVSLALVGVLDEETSEVQIKWPNDIYVGNRKIAGILIENSIKGTTINSAVVGVGLNLNQEVFTSGAANPVSLKQLTQKNYDTNEVLRQFLENFDNLFQLLKMGQHDAIEKAYLNRLLGKDEWRTYRKQHHEFEAKITGIGEFGKLQMEDRSGQTLEFMFKEVEFVL